MGRIHPFLAAVHTGKKIVDNVIIYLGIDYLCVAIEYGAQYRKPTSFIHSQVTGGKARRPTLHKTPGTSTIQVNLEK